MSSLFEGCSSLTSLNMLPFDTNNVKDIKNMFKGCSSLNELDLDFISTQNVKDMTSMFESCSSLDVLDLSSFTITGNTTMTDMFRNTSSLKFIRLGSKVSNSITEDIFSGTAADGILSYPVNADYGTWLSNSIGLGKYGWTAEEVESAGGHSMVDLGLSVKWASTNLGASSPYEPGDYYAWGETFTKSVYTMGTYTFTDDVEVLPSSADAASVSWGEGWRMPTCEEAAELVNFCDWTPIRFSNAMRNISGWKVTGRGVYSSNSIIIMGDGAMNGTINENKGDVILFTSTYDHDDLAYVLYTYYYGPDMGRGNKPLGTNIRPVHE